MKIAPPWLSASALLLVLFASLTVVPAWAQAAGPDPRSRISVTGQGSRDLAPDMAILDLAVVREAATAREALTANNRAMAEVLAELGASGIAARDLQTTGFSIQPRMVYPQNRNGGEPPRIVGYTARNGLTVRVRDLTRLGLILDQAVTLGVNQGGDVRFTNDKPDEAIKAARELAMADAIARANTLVTAAGARLGRLISIDEQGSRPSPMPMASARMMSGAADSAAVPMAAGENSYTVQVSVTWEIEQ
ncbi:MAG: SIMPL domain-containing protein [Burkholderiaceae bacterium]